MRQFFEEISKHLIEKEKTRTNVPPPLDENGKRIQLNFRQQYSLEISRHPPLTHLDEIALKMRSNLGDESAQIQMINSNLKIGLRPAASYAEHSNISFMDWVQAANVGLLNAFRTYDPIYKTRFHTHAYSAVKDQLNRMYYETKGHQILTPSQVKEVK